jgi:hypothetical protein
MNYEESFDRTISLARGLRGLITIMTRFCLEF